MTNVTNRLVDVNYSTSRAGGFYLTDEERKAFLKAAARTPRRGAVFCSTLHYTGCRISEALALTPKALTLSGRSSFLKLEEASRGVSRRAFPI